MGSKCSSRSILQLIKKLVASFKFMYSVYNDRSEVSIISWYDAAALTKLSSNVSLLLFIGLVKGELVRSTSELRFPCLSTGIA